MHIWLFLIAIVLADFDPEYQPNFYNYDRNFDSQYEHPDFPNNRHKRGSLKNVSSKYYVESLCL